jgi:hypothetical protein
VDSPSYQDANDLETNLLSYFFLQQTFEKVENARFVLTISMSGFDGRMLELNTLFRRFVEMFVFDRTFTVRELANSTVLVVTSW